MVDNVHAVLTEDNNGRIGDNTRTESKIFSVVIMVLLLLSTVFVGISFNCPELESYVLIGIAIGCIVLSLILYLVYKFIYKRSLLSNTITDSSDISYIQKELDHLAQRIHLENKKDVERIDNLSSLHSEIRGVFQNQNVNVSKYNLFDRQRMSINNANALNNDSFHLRTRDIFPEMASSGICLTEFCDKPSVNLHHQTQLMELHNERKAMGRDNYGNCVYYIENSTEEIED